MTPREAKIRVLRGAADLLLSAIDTGDGWAYDAPGDPPEGLPDADVRRVNREIRTLGAALHARADRLERR